MKKDGKSVVILGFGWLGQHLSAHLTSQKYQFEATVRDPKKAAELGVQHFNVTPDGQLNHNITLQNALWVCCIPPGFRKAERHYFSVLEAALNLAASLNMKGFLLCSSTGVYPSASHVMTEYMQIDIESQKQQLLLEAENRVLENQQNKVVRLAGLIGPKRHPGRFVAGKVLNSSANERVNMIHQSDASAAIMHLLEKWDEAQSIYNLVTPDHPTKQAFYRAACAQLAATAPCFETDDVIERIIDGQAIEALGFNYCYQTLSDALIDC